jgi:hypothetical protein
MKMFKEIFVLLMKIADQILVDGKSPETIRYIDLVDDHSG